MTKTYPAGYRPRPRNTTTRLLVGWCVAGTAGIAATILALGGGTPAPAPVPAATVSAAAGYTWSCVGTVPQACTVAVQAAR